MKLLIVTQKVDSEDPILGFFHRWIEMFSEHCERVTVVGQSVGRHALPQNVQALSLGKEHGIPKQLQILRFWWYQIKHRQSYDAVLVHMTPIWVILGAPLWKLLGKRMYLWYEVRRGRWYLPIAVFLVRHVFSATVHGLPRPSRKQSILGHGIDTEMFKPDAEKKEDGLIVTVGRITPVKHFDVIIRSFAALPDSYQLVIAGGAFIESDKVEQGKLEELVSELGIDSRVSMGFRQHSEVMDLLQRAELFLHACEGGLDKVLLEAMASGCLALSTSEAAAEVLPGQCKASYDSYSARTQALCTLPPEEKEALATTLRSIVEKDHNLPHLIQEMYAKMH